MSDSTIAFYKKVGHSQQIWTRTRPELLCPQEENISIKEQKWLYKCRVEDMNIKGNNSWKYQDISCLSCNKNIDKTQSYILHYQGKTKISHTYQVTMNSTQEIYWRKSMCQTYSWRTLTEELLLFSPCELWISFTCSTVYSYGYKYI